MPTLLHAMSVPGPDLLIEKQIDPVHIRIAGISYEYKHAACAVMQAS